MRFYLLSNFPCYVKANGTLLGRANGNVCSFEISEGEFLLQLVPPFPKKELSCFIKKGECNNPFVRIIDLYGDFLIIPHFFDGQKNSLLLCFDKYFSASGLKINLIDLNGLKLILENEHGFFATCIEQSEIVKISADVFNNFAHVCFYLKDGILFYLFDVSEKPKQILFERCNDISFSNAKILLTKKTPFLRVFAIHTEISLSPFKRISRANYDLNTKINSKLIPYAFLQEVQYKLNFKELLSEELSSSAHLIPDFLGEFSAFAPFGESDCENTHRVLIVGERAKILEFNIKDNLICDLSII